MALWDTEILPPKQKSSYITDCDKLAAHPYDPQRVADGVWFEDLESDQAVQACRQAVTEFPNMPRLEYQLGRALNKKGSDFDGVQHYDNAAKAGYTMAKYILMTENKDKALALKDAQSLAQDGFKPANLEVADLLRGESIFASAYELEDKDKMGLKNLEIAAKAGYPEAHVKLAKFYTNYGTNITGGGENGLKGLYHDILAEMISTRFGRQQDAQNARKRVLEIYSYFSSEQIAEVWHRAATWKPDQDFDYTVTDWKGSDR